MTVKNWGSLPIRSQEDVVIVRQSIRRFGLEIGLNLIDQTKIVTAASELARNAFIYGGGGEVHVEELEERGRRGLRLTFVDQGPGIADVEKAMKDGYTSGHGLGLGLGGAKRLANEFSICSEPDKGTRVVITKWKS